MGRRAASNLPRASRPPPRPLNLCMHVAIACARVRGRLRASAILTPFVGTAHFSRARCRTVATPLPRTRCSVEAVGAYPMPTLCLPYAYPTPTLCLVPCLPYAYPMPAGWWRTTTTTRCSTRRTSTWPCGLRCSASSSPQRAGSRRPAAPRRHPACHSACHPACMP